MTPLTGTLGALLAGGLLAAISASAPHAPGDTPRFFFGLALLVVGVVLSAGALA